MKTKTLIVFYLILFITGIAISGYSQTIYHEDYSNQHSLKNKTKAKEDKTDKLETGNSFDNLNVIYRLYYCGKENMA